jgi:hypothetical protein
MTKILEQPVDRFPLAWPVGWPRTTAGDRKRAPFFRVSTSSYSTGQGAQTQWHQRKDKKPLTMAGAVEQLMRECERLGAQGPVLSTNVELRLDGQPRGDRAMPSDVGVALYFRHKNKPIVMACDKWSTVADNIAAIARHIETIRAQDRYGVGRLEQALAGYQRLLTGRRAWWEVLGFSTPPVVWEIIQTKHRELQVKYHPDRHHDATILTEINEAFETAKEEFGR